MWAPSRWLRHPGTKGGIACAIAALGLAVLGSFGAGSGWGQSAGPYGDSETLRRLVQFETRMIPPAAHPGEQVRLVTTAALDKGWHMYSLQPTGEFGPIPTSVTTLAPGLEVAGPPYENNPFRLRDPAFNLVLAYHQPAARFYQNLTVPTGKEAYTAAVEQRIRYQLCDDRFCVPPRTDTLRTALDIQPGAVRPEYRTMLRTVDTLDSSGSFRLDPDSMEGALAGGLRGFLLLALTFGVLALASPCVFPMIPVTVSFFAIQAQEGRSTTRLALLFGLGVMACYTGLGLGITMIFGASGVGKFASSPWMNLVVAGFFLFFALTLLGWLGLALPATWVSALDLRSRRIPGAVGTLMIGVAFTAASFTCTMPFVGTLLVAAAQGQLWWPLLGMVVFSGVLALPFVLLTVFPNWLVQLRGRAGPWLRKLELLVALGEIGVALKFLGDADLAWGWGLFTRELTLWVWAALALLCAAILVRPAAAEAPAGTGIKAWLARLWGRLRGQQAPVRPWQRTAATALAGAVFVGLSLYLTWGAIGHELDPFIESYAPRAAAGAARSAPELEVVERLPWQPSLEQALAVAGPARKPVFLEFTGYTCVNCRWMDRRVISKPEVLAVLREQFVLVRLYTDLGPGADANQRLQVDRFRTLAMPFFVILAPDNSVIALHTGILPSVPGFMEFLEQGRRATAAAQPGAGPLAAALAALPPHTGSPPRP